MPAAPRNIVWIASYPKSGNTWVRFMACNLLFGRQESASTLNTLAPDIHEMGSAGEDPAPSGLLKTHFVFSSKLPHAERSAAAIYVVRDPADVLASNFFYAQRSAPGTADSAAAFDHYYEQFIEYRGDPRWNQLGMGSWETNVLSWRQAGHSFPVLRIRYEYMVADPISACREIAKLLRPESTEEDIRQAVLNSSFQRMRDVERADIRDKRAGIFYKPYLQTSIDSGSRFMRRGVVGDGSARLTAEQRLRLRSLFGPLLRELGYPGN
jgi:Sulfotransferase domain